MPDTRSFVFGPGACWAIMQNFTDGTSPTTVSPRKFDVLQEFSVDFGQTIKELTGQLTYPVALGIGEGKITIKITMARFQAGVLNDAIFGRNTATGLAVGRNIIVDPPERFTAAATYAVANAATFVQDLGVFDQVSGAQLVAVAAAPTTGQYIPGAANVGSYSFAAADVGHLLMVNYMYHSAATGQTLTVFSEIQGAVGISRMLYTGQYAGRYVAIDLPNVVASKFTYASKQKDFIMGVVDAAAFATPAGIAAYMYLLE